MKYLRCKINAMRTLSPGEVKRAVREYARRHGHYIRTVRTMTVLFRAAIKEYVEGTF